MVKQVVLLALILGWVYPVTSKNLHVGVGFPYGTLYHASNSAEPGDTIMLHEGNHATSQIIKNLKGKKHKPIVIASAPSENAIFKGGSRAILFENASYVVIDNLVFDNQFICAVDVLGKHSEKNECNNIVFKNCLFKSKMANGNNRLLKMQHVNNFTIENCFFQNGALYGSGIDLINCHQSFINKCSFKNMGTNSIQFQKGSSAIKMNDNKFTNKGNRSYHAHRKATLSLYQP